MMDQAYKLRQLAAERGRYAPGRAALPLLVVAGGASGAGASAAAWGVSLALNDLGHRTLLVGGEPVAAVQNRDSENSLANCLLNEQRLLDALEYDPHGLWLLPADFADDAVADCSAAAQQHLLRQLHDLRSRLDVAVLDVGSYRNPFVRRLWREASMVLLVSGAEPAALTETYAAIKLLLAGETSVPIYTCINAVTDPAWATVAQERLQATCRQFLGVRTTPLGMLSRGPHGMVITELDHLAAQIADELGLLNRPAAGPTTLRAAA